MKAAGSCAYDVRRIITARLYSVLQVNNLFWGRKKTGFTGKSLKPAKGGLRVLFGNKAHGIQNLKHSLFITQNLKALFVHHSKFESTLCSSLKTWNHSLFITQNLNVLFVYHSKFESTLRSSLKFWNHSSLITQNWYHTLFIAQNLKALFVHH